MLNYDEETGQAIPYWATVVRDQRGRALEVYEIPLHTYLGTKPPARREFWKRVHAGAVASAVDLGKSGVTREGHTDAELEEARLIRRAVVLREPEAIAELGARRKTEVRAHGGK